MNNENTLIIDLATRLNNLQLRQDNFEIEDLISIKPSNAPVDIETSAQINGKRYALYVDVVATERTAILREKMKRLKATAERTGALPLVGGKFFSEADMNIASQEGVSLFDLTGNIYFNLPNFHYERIVRKNLFPEKTKLADLFAPIASRITRVLLINHTKTWSLHELAEEAEVSIGLTHRIIARMIEQEIVNRGEDKRLVLSNPGLLLDEWRVKRYKQQQFKFYSFKHDSLLETLSTVHMTHPELRYGLGFFAGALLIAPFIRGFDTMQIYITSLSDLAAWKKILDLKEVEKGQNTELYIPYDEGVFYSRQEITTGKNSSKISVVSNVQLYMDLFNNPARGEEQAEHLREVKLQY
ncbi:MAG TPA: hypothetical protein VMR41_02510 [Patescibacteria group bacterium]|nr:hypothetical protein [Patescibacteria group bacterium]